MRTGESRRCVRFSTLAPGQRPPLGQRPALGQRPPWASGRPSRCGFYPLMGVVYRLRRSFQAARIAGSVGFDTREPMT